MNKTFIVIILVALSLCVKGAPAPASALVQAKAAIDDLWTPVDDLYKNVGTKNFGKKGGAILGNFKTLYAKIDELSITAPVPETEFKQFNEYKSETTDNMELFEIIMKLLYTQADRSRTDFLFLGGPHIRMYAFGVLGKICHRFANDVDRKKYLMPHLQVTDPPRGIYTKVEQIVIKDDVGLLEDDPNLFGPFVEAIETIEAQIYKFYKQWNFNTPTTLNTGEQTTLDCGMHNILVFLDYIMKADDLITLEQPEGDANYIYFFEHNTVLEVLELIAEYKSETITPERQNLKTYANFLLDTYFTGEPVTATPDFRLVPRITDNVPEFKIL